MAEPAAAMKSTTAGRNKKDCIRSILQAEGRAENIRASSSNNCRDYATYIAICHSIKHASRTVENKKSAAGRRL